MKEENYSVASQQEKYFLDTFPLINQIVFSKAGIVPTRFLEDLVQQVRLKLWKWKEKNKKFRQLNFEEWQRLANVVTKNEITDYSRRKDNQSVLFSEMEENGSSLTEFPDPFQVEGNSFYESMTFLLLVWGRFENLSLRQKYAFLISKQENFLELLLKFGCCSPVEIAKTLVLSEAEFVILLGKFPLEYEDIQQILTKISGEQLTLEQISAARNKARRNLLQSVKDK